MCVNNLPKVALDSREADCKSTILISRSPSNTTDGTVVHYKFLISRFCVSLLWLVYGRSLRKASIWKELSMCIRRSLNPIWAHHDCCY